LGIFSRGKEDEKGEVFGNVVKFVGLVGAHVENGARSYGLGFILKLKTGSPGNDVVDFVFGVGLLGIYSPGRETIKAHAEGGDVEKFEVMVGLPVMPGKEFFEMVGAHRISWGYARWRTLCQ
jgi:hypothetical protein